MNKLMWNTIFRYTSDDASVNRIDKKASGARDRNTGAKFGTMEMLVDTSWDSLDVPGAALSATFTFGLYNAGSTEILVRTQTGASQFMRIPAGKISVIGTRDTTGLEVKCATGSSYLIYFMSGN